jgi:predicted naringenin-chalcone synthase
VTSAYLQAIGTAVPDHDVHDSFITWARGQLSEARDVRLFDRMAARAGIDHRWSVLPREIGSPTQEGGFYAAAPLPGTAQRMQLYAAAAPELALAAIADCAQRTSVEGITHIVVASCTGFVAPGIDQIIAARLGLANDVERLLIGFMGCYAAIVALRTARHIVRSEPHARVLVVTVELSTLHLQEATTLEPLLAMLQFGDGAAAALVTSTAGGLELGQPFSAALPDSAELIQWEITDRGFAMTLSGEVPSRLTQALSQSEFMQAALGRSSTDEIDAWAVHAGGRSILDAVEHALELAPDALNGSRDVLRRHGNMSSATLMFVLKDMIGRSVNRGCALAFGPGLAAEGLTFTSSS